MAIGRDAMTKEVSDRRKRVMKIKDLMGSPAAKGRMSPMKMSASSPMAAPDMESPPAAMKKGGRVVKKGKEDKMRGGGMAVKGKGVAMKKGGAVKRPGLMVMIALGKSKKGK